MIGREKPGEQSEVAQLIQQTLEQERWQREMMEQRYNQYMDEQEVGVPAAAGGEAEVNVECRLITPPLPKHTHRDVTDCKKSVTAHPYRDPFVLSTADPLCFTPLKRDHSDDKHTRVMLSRGRPADTPGKGDPL